MYHRTNGCTTADREGGCGNHGPRSGVLSHVNRGPVCKRQGAGKVGPHGVWSKGAGWVKVRANRPTTEAKALDTIASSKVKAPMCRMGETRLIGPRKGR